MDILGEQSGYQRKLQNFNMKIKIAFAESIEERVGEGTGRGLRRGPRSVVEWNRPGSQNLPFKSNSLNSRQQIPLKLQKKMTLEMGFFNYSPIFAARSFGEMAEWSIAAVLKTVVP
jgi:hypothetical protein